MHADDSNVSTSSDLAQQMTGVMPGPPLALLSSDDGSLAFVHHRFPPSSGAMGHPTQLRLALVLRGGGRLQQHCALGPGLNAQWTVGQFNIVLPGQIGTFVSPAVEILGLAIDQSFLDRCLLNGTLLTPLAGSLHRDPMISSMLHAFRATAEANLLSDQFLRSGTQSIVHRLVQLAQRPAFLPPSARPLTTTQMQELTAYIDAWRDARLDVSMMAGALKMEVTRFRRSIQAATGMSPHAFLTHRRMQWARSELERGVSVMKVAQCVGYANASKFSAAFRRVVGQSPSASRR